jgi:hypothetical protein
LSRAHRFDVDAASQIDIARSRGHPRMPFGPAATLKSRQSSQFLTKTLHPTFADFR